MRLATEKSDGLTDYCLENGWYGDGVCDDWCPQQDPDCQPPGCGTDFDCANGEICRRGGCFPCPRLSPPTPGFCPDGKIEVRFNDSGTCVVGFECVTPADHEQP